MVGSLFVLLTLTTALDPAGKVAGPRLGRWRRRRRGRGRRGQLQRLRGAGAVAVAGASAERGCFKSPWVRGRLALPQEPPIFAQAISLPSIWVSLSDGVLHSSPARDVVG